MNFNQNLPTQKPQLQFIALVKEQQNGKGNNQIQGNNQSGQNTTDDPPEQFDPFSTQLLNVNVPVLSNQNTNTQGQQLNFNMTLQQKSQVNLMNRTNNVTDQQQFNNNNQVQPKFNINMQGQQQFNNNTQGQLQFNNNTLSQIKFNTNNQNQQQSKTNLQDQFQFNNNNQVQPRFNTNMQGSQQFNNNTQGQQQFNNNTLSQIKFNTNMQNQQQPNINIQGQFQFKNNTEVPPKFNTNMQSQQLSNNNNVNQLQFNNNMKFQQQPNSNNILSKQIVSTPQQFSNIFQTKIQQSYPLSNESTTSTQLSIPNSIQISGTEEEEKKKKNQAELESIVSRCKIVENKNTSLKICIYPTYKESQFKDISEFKTLIMIGETGVGKSTTINFFCNYYLGVQYDYPFRFLIVNETGEEFSKSQAVSKTSKVNTYFIKSFDGKPGLRIIDTPGFADTRGQEYDEIISEQITDSLKKIDSITMICFVQSDF